MIPSVLARQLRETVLDYLGTTFALADQDLHDALARFLAGPGGLFRGPFIELRLPFRVASADPRIFLDYAPPFASYQHQLNAFERLSSRSGRQPQHTVVTTGTGSGKTECFLYPILDHCLRHASTPGIKAILLYPMNALATDQGRRLARLLASDPRLHGRVSAGVYIGGDGRHGVADADHLVDKREVLRASPPDILLTNYKMLDFLLMRPDDRALWQHNGTDTLRYLVLDELHTYDGAQGSDVACLIRRLRARLGITPGTLTFVGTSATLGGEKGARARLAEFASLLAGEAVGEQSVLGEDRYDAAEALGDDVDLATLPDARDRERLDPDGSADPAAWIAAQKRLWLGRDDLTPVETAQHLRRHAFLRSLLRALDGKVLSWEALSESLARAEAGFADLDDDTRWLVAQSFLGLVSAARVEADGHTRPFLSLRVQLWVRELRRLMRAVRPDTDPLDTRYAFAWHDEIAEGSGDTWLPMARCWECGVGGWAAVLPEGLDALRANVTEIGRAWLSSRPTARFVIPGEAQGEGRELAHDEFLCPRCLRLGTTATCACGSTAIAVRGTRLAEHDVTLKPPRRWRERCVNCNATGSLTVLGARGPSLGSVVVTHLFLSPYNDDRKLLAFTDSVQDASHHASFFGARTWRFSVRTAMQSVLVAHDDEPSLATLAERLLARACEAPTLRARIEQWLPTDLADLPETLRYRDKPDDRARQEALWSRIATRLSWEVAQEYGLGARSLGRTLERTGCSTAHPDDGALDEATAALVDDIRAHKLLGPRSDEAQADDVRHLLDAALDRLRVRGGIFHPLLDRYVHDGANRFLLSKRRQPLLSPFARGVRPPSFLQGPMHADGFESFAPLGNPELSWHRDLVTRIFRVPSRHVDVAKLYKHAMARLAAQGVVEERECDRAPVWGLTMASLRVSAHVALVRCERCRETTSLARSVAERMAGHACLRFGCDGALRALAHPEGRYYAKVYRGGRSPRILPAEHTGLLDRETRETLEDRFKAGTDPGAPNLLVCTPTLEMGIDVGDLSAVMTCSVPPTTANHVQRVGRAGRSTGNALAVGIALSRAHDQYFFEDPREMIAGAVEPPGMFLDAPEVLWRQLLAFILDRWARDATTLTRIPRAASEVLGASRDRFLGDLTRFDDAHRAALVEDFLAMFSARVSAAPQVSDENVAWIRERAARVRPTDAVVAAFDALEAEIHELEKLRDRMQQHVRSLEAKPVESDALAADRDDAASALAVVVRSLVELRKKYPLNVLTDAGVLPNYAFPEPGVTLRAMIEQDRDPEGRAKPSPADGKKRRPARRWEAREYLRPASSALREFAPFNTFYAEGRHLEVTDVDLGSPERPLVSPWRFCPRCDHAEPATDAAPSAACPRCGAHGWDDAGQRHELVAFRVARSFTPQHESLTVDASDERDEESYRVADLIDVRELHWGGARASTSPLFGVEFLHDLVLREINFGPDADRDETVSVAEREVPARGFVVCPECGRVQRNHGTAEKTDHAVHCARRRGASTRKELLPVWLSREVKSEAIRLLLPASTVDVDVARSSFRAALLLGLRKRFHGRPMHLLVKATSEPVANRGDARRTFLVLYDAVPGGTGYLRELWRTDGIETCMRLALDVLERCPCRLDPERDGCYRCLLGHHTSFEKVKPSRRRAVELLRDALLAWPLMSKVPTLSEVSVDTLLESELERRFVAALHAHVVASGGAWSPTVHHGKAECARLTLGGESWLLEPQVDVEVSAGASPRSRPDFVLWSQRDDARDLAVFCDGYEFHAQPEAPRGRVYDDLDKRAALIASGRWRVWSVTWSDLDHFTGAPSEPAPSVFDAAPEATVDQLAKRLGSPLAAGLHRNDAMRTLVTWLAAPDEAPWTAYAGALLLATMMGTQRVSRSSLDAAEEALWTSDAPVDAPTLAGDPSGPDLGALRAGTHWALLARVPVAAVQQQRWAELRAVLRLYDEAPRRARDDFRPSWRAALLAWNLLQFQRGVAVLSSEQDRATQRDLARVAAAVREAPAPGDGWAQVFGLVDASCEPLARALCAAGVEAPTVGDDLTHRGRVVATAELAWREARVAVLLDDARVEGWTVFAPADDARAIEAALTAR